MDLYVERQYVSQMKSENLKQFLLLFDAFFEKLYRYVFRRTGDIEETEKLVRLAFLDALGQVKSTPEDTSYEVWLYSLSKPRVWNYIDKASFPEKQGLISVQEEVLNEPVKADIVEKARKMMVKLTLEEREILRLKFFESLADAEVAYILGAEEAAIGKQIYRVLKRASLLLFGESDDRRGVYFGELSSLLDKVHDMENIDIPAALKFSLRADLSSQIGRKDFVVETETFQDDEAETVKKPTQEENSKEKEEVPSNPWATGSNDPAKIFVAAVKEMKEEEEIKAKIAEEEMEKGEALADIFDKVKGILIAVPILVFLVVAGVVGYKMWPFGLEWPSGDDDDDSVIVAVDRGYPTDCDIEVQFEGDFEDGVKRNVNQQISDKICDHFEGVKKLTITRTGNTKVEVSVDIKDWVLDYDFVKKVANWRIKRYARTADSNIESGEV